MQRELANPEDRIRTMSGVSKRLFMALSDLRGTPPQLEDALFQMAAVIDATSKYHYPDENSSKRRFIAYLESVTTDVFRIATPGGATFVDCTFMGTDGIGHSFGEIIYNIRCSSYHDPNELEDLIHWGEENVFGVKDGRFVVNQQLLTALFLILISDDANKDRIDTSLFTDDHHLVVNGVKSSFLLFVGNRRDLFRVLGFRD